MRILVITGILLLAVVGAHSGLWFYAAHEAEAEIRGRMAAAGAAGLEVEASLRLSGYPFNVTVDLIDLSVAPKAPATPLAPAGGWSWTADHVSAGFAPWQPRALTVTFDGRHGIVVDDDDDDGGGGGKRRFDLRLTGATADVTLDDRGLAQVAVELAHVAIANMLPPAADFAVPAVIDGLTMAYSRRVDERMRGLFANPEEGADPLPLAAVVGVDLKGLLVPGLAPPALGDRLRSLELEAGIFADPLPALTHDGLVAWGADGGVMRLRAFDLIWGGLRITASGPLSIDALGRPNLALDASVVGYRRLFDAFAEAGIIDADYAATGKTMAGLLAPPGPQQAASLPIMVSGGLLFLGPIPITEIGPLIP